MQTAELQCLWWNVIHYMLSVHNKSTHLVCVYAWFQHLLVAAPSQIVQACLATFLIACVLCVGLVYVRMIELPQNALLL